MNIRCGVHTSTIFIHFEVYMRAGRAACTAHQRDNIAFANDITNINFIFLAMRITRFVAIAVVYFNQVTIAISWP